MKALKEYSKRVIRLMIILWFVGAIYGMAAVTYELAISYLDTTITVHLPELLTYIGAPVGGGIVGYMCKSAWENKEKIKNGALGGFDSDHSCMGANDEGDYK